MTKQTLLLNKLSILPMLLTTINMLTVNQASAQRVVIYFNDPQALLAIPGDCLKSRICSGAPFTEANFYKEDNMIFIDGVNP